MRHAKVVKRVVDADKRFNNILVARLINRIMRDGKKTIAEKKIYATFEILVAKTKEEPLVVFEKAMQTVGPKVEVKARRLGGANYQVPVEVRGERRVALALRWIIEAARKRSNKDFPKFEDKLAAEIIDATNNLGEAVKKRDTMVRQADANKAFAHFKF